MSKYTTELRWVVEQSLDDQGAAHGEANWPLVYDKVGLADYPIFDEGYRQTLNDKIIRHYYTREIGAETVGRFRMFVRDAMHRIMPYYNQLYESEVLAKQMEPLGDRNLKHTEHAWGTSESTGTATGETSTTSTTTSSDQNVYSDTPQSEMIPAQIKNMQYATNVTLDDQTGSENSNVESSNDSSANGKYDNMVERTESGYARPQSELLQLYRETFLNIDNDVVRDIELAQCFMTIW